MGDAQSAQREGRKDEEAEEESGKVHDAQAEQCTEDKPFKNNVQISEINEKAGISIAEVNGLCEDGVAADAVLSPDEDISETEIPLEEEEEAPEEVERNEKDSSNEVDVAEDVPPEMTEMDGKKNDINDSFRKFFSNIGLRLSIKRGSTDLLKDLPDETNNEERCDEEVVVKETESGIPEQNNDTNTARGTHDNDSTTAPTMTDLTPEDVLGNAEEKATEAKEEAGSDDAEEAKTPPEAEETDQEATPEDELQDSPEQGEFVSPIKKFFTSGIFSGLRKKRKPAEEEMNEKEMIDMGQKDGVEVMEETEEEQQLDKEQIDPGIEASADETEHKENEHKQEILPTTSPETTDEGKSSTTDPSTDILPEPETLKAREKDKVPSSPLKRLLSGSSFRKLSKKPRSRRSSDSRLSDSGEHTADQLLSSTESAEIQKEEGPAQPPSEATGEEDSAWASFKKLLTPKKRRRAPSLSNKETETPAEAEKAKPSEGEQISDQSTDEDKKRKDSSVSWEAVLCGSGKKRSRKTSDSEDETPPNDNKQDLSSKPSAGSPQESSNQRKNSLVSSPRVRSDGEGPTTWITFRRLVTPKRKAKDEDESKDNVQSDGEVSQDESSFSIKKLLPGRKKRKSPEKQDQVSSDEADKDVPSGDEDSETPAVVPLSEFDTPESMVQIQTQAEIESHSVKGSDYEVPEDLHQSPEPVPPCDDVQNEEKTSEESEAENRVTTTPAKDEELDDDSEVVSKHQQLSDITEEGIITETMATPVSIHEEAGRDDTIAEDLMEMTSEAITAPEPASVTTLADETEMISAVSQLSTESSKTSGNTTPVPAEYEVMETDALLQQVVETVTTTPEAVAISSSNTKSESIVSSVLNQIFKTFMKEDKETAVLEIHSKSEATAIKTGEAVEEMDEVKEPTAAAQTEGMSEVSESEPSEILPEALEKLEAAEREVHEVHQTRQELCESERVPEETAPGEGSTDEKENPEMEAASLELKEETEPRNEVQVEPEKVDELETDAARGEHAPVPDAPISEQASKSDPDEESEQLPEVITGDIPPAESTGFDLPFRATELDDTQESEVIPSNVEDTVIETNTEEDVFIDAREMTQSVDEGSASLPLSEGTTEQVDASETEDLAPPTEESLEPMDSATVEPTGEPEELQTEQTRRFDTEEPQQEIEVSNEPENEKTPLGDTTAEDEQVKEPEAPVMYSEGGGVQSLPTEEQLEDVPVPDGLKEESTPLIEDGFELLDATKAEHVEEPEVFDTVQASPDSSMDNLLSPDDERPEDTPSSEPVADEGKQETEASVQPDDVQELEELPSDIVDTEIETSTEDFFISVDEGNAPLPASDVTLEQVDDSKTEDVQEQEELPTLQPLPIDSHVGDRLTLEKAMTEDVPGAGVTDEPQTETEVRVEAQEELRDEGSLMENVEVAEVSPSEVEDTAKDSALEEGASFDEPVATESVDEDTAAGPSTGESLEPMESSTAEQVGEPEELQTSLFNTEEPQKEVELVEEDVEIEKVQEPEVLPLVVKDVVKETLIEKEAAAPIPEVTESTEEISATVPPLGGCLEPMDPSTAEQVRVQEPQTVQASPLDLEAGFGEIAEDIPAGEMIVEEPQKETEVRADAPEKIEVEADTTDSVQEPEDLPSAERDIVQETVNEEGANMHVIVATDSNEEQRAPTPPTEPSPEPVNVSETEDAQEGEVLDTEEGPPLDSEEGSKPPLETETSGELTVTDDPQKETEARDEEPEVLPSDVDDTVKEVRFEPLEEPEGENVQEPEVLQSAVEDAVKETLIEKDAPVPVPEVTESIGVDRETGPVTGGSPEPVDLSTTEQVQVRDDPEPVGTVEASPFDSGLTLPLEILKTEDITALETATDELKPTTVVRVEADTAEFTQEPEEPTSTPQDTDQEISVITALTEQSPETVDVARTEDKQEPEEVNERQEAESDPKASSLQPFENVMSKDVPAAETVTDEPQEETERELPAEARATEYVQEQEETPAPVEDIAQDTSAEEGATIQEPVLTESTDEVFETAPHTAQSPEPVGVSGTGDVQEPEALNTAQGLPQDSTEGDLLNDKVMPEDKPAVEIILDEPQQDTDIRVEPQDINPVEADTPVTEQRTESEPNASGLTSENVISEDVPTVESVTDEPQKDIKETTEPAEEQPAEAFESEIQEPEELPSYVEDIERDILNKEGTTTDILAAPESVIECSAEIPVPEESLELVDALKTEKVQGQDDIAQDTSAEEGATIQEPVLTGSTDEVFETAPHTAQSPEPVVVSGTGDVQEPEALNTAVQDSPMDSKVESLLPLEKETPEDKPAVETVPEELQKEMYVTVEPQEQQSVGADTSKNVQEPDALKEQDETPAEEGTTIRAPDAKESIDGGKATTPLTEESLVTVDASAMEDAQEPVVLMGSLPPLEKVASEDVPAVEIVTKEPQEETEARDEEPEVLPSGIEDTLTEAMTEVGDVVIKGPEPSSEETPQTEESLEPGGAQIPCPDGSLELQLEKTVETVTNELIQEAAVRAEPQEEQPLEVAKTENDREAEVSPSDGEDKVKETQTEEGTSVSEEGVEKQIPQDASRPDPDDAVADVLAQLDRAEQSSEGHETESNQQDLQAEQGDLTPEFEEALATKPQDHVAAVHEESNVAQVLENTTISEEAPRAVDESKHEVPLSAVQVSVQEEKESPHPSTETKTDSLEHAIVPEEVTCYLKEVSATIPDVLQEKTSDGAEPVLDSVESQEVSEGASTATLLVKEDFDETAEKDGVAQMMHVPLVESEDDQVQVAEVNVKSMERIVDKMLEVTEMKAVFEVCHETVEEEDVLSAPPDVDEEVTQEETQTTVEDVQHEKENLPEMAPESVVVEEAVLRQPDAVGELCELTERELDQKEHQEVMDDGSGTLKERQDVVPGDDPATSQQGSEDVEQTVILEETNAEEVKLETGVTAGEVKPLSEESDVNEVPEPAQGTESGQGLDATPSDTELKVPQNTDVISSAGNIQFGQAKAQPPPAPTTDGDEPVTKEDVSEDGVQTEEPLKPVQPITQTHQAENQRNTDLAEVEDRPTDTAAAVSTLASTARAVITTHPVQMILGFLTFKTVKPMATPPGSPPLTAERAEPVVETDEIRVQAMESVEPVTQRAQNQNQTEITEVKDQLTEISEPALLQDSTEKAVTEPELLASPLLEEETDKLLKQLGAGVDAGELIEPADPINLAQEAESQTQTEQTDVSDQPTGIAEQEATLEVTERAVITELMDIGTCASETEELVAEEKGSPQLQNEGIEQLTSTDVSEVEPVEPVNPSQRAERQIEPTEVNVHQNEITEQVAHSYKEERAVIITQPVLWDLAIHKIETVEPVPKAAASPLQTSERVEAMAEDVSKEEVVEIVDPVTQRAESQTELTKADDQAAEISEPSGSAGGAMMTTHPMVLDVGLQESEIKGPAAVEMISEETGGIDLKLSEVSEVEVKADAEVEPAEPNVLTQGAESQIEPVVVDVQPTEIKEPVLPLDPTEGAVIATQPVLLEVAVHATETSELESKAPASPSVILENAEASTPTGVSNDGAQAVEVEEPITPTQTAEEQKQAELSEVGVLEIKITEPEEHLSAPEITETAVITTHPMLLDVGIHTTETADPVANAPDSPTVTADMMEPLKQMDVLGSDIQTEQAGSTQEAESLRQSEVPETSPQAAEITEPEVHFDLTQIAVITTPLVLLDDGLYTIETEGLEVEEAEDQDNKAVEKVTSSIQSTETVCQTENEVVILSEPPPSEACDQETPVRTEHVSNPEVENEQDVWLDAEEGDFTQEETETTYLEVEEHLESVAESVPEEEVRFEEEAEIDLNVQPEEEESRHEEYKTGEVCEIESEGEDFAIALEHQEYATARITTLEWD